MLWNYYSTFIIIEKVSKKVQWVQSSKHDCSVSSVVTARGRWSISVGGPPSSSSSVGRPWWGAIAEIPPARGRWGSSVHGGSVGGVHGAVSTITSSGRVSSSSSCIPTSPSSAASAPIGVSVPSWMSILSSVGGGGEGTRRREREKNKKGREKKTRREKKRGENEELTTPRNNVWRLPNSGILNGKKLTFRTKFCDKTREISLKESGTKLWESLVETPLTWGVQISPGFHCGVGRIDRIVASCSEGTKADPAHHPCTAGWSCLPPGRRSRWKWRHRKHCPWQGHGSWLETTEGDKNEYNIAVVQYLHNCSCHNQRH